MTHLRLFLADLALVLAAIALSILLVMLGLWIAGYPAHLVLADWFHGAVGTRFDLLVSLKNACPLILTGLAAGIAFRSGVFNIGAEGQSILGAIAAATLATRLLPNLPTPWLAIPLTLLAAMLCGAAWAAIAALLDRARGVPIVLSTILLNFIALQLLGLLVEGPLQGTATIGQTDPLPHSYWLPLLSGPAALHAGILIAVTAAAISWLIQARTAFGFEIRVVGLNPLAARLAGMPVAARQTSVMLLSGAFAGLAGAIQTTGVSHFLSTTSPGYGYAGIAVALLGRLHPAGILLAALFFGFLDQGAANVEISRYELPREVADIVKGLVVLVILVGAAYVARIRTTARER